MKNPTYEQALQKQGAPFTYLEAVADEAISAQKGLSNQARLEVPLDDALVEAYALALKAGDVFPPLVLARLGRNRYYPLDGNQRLAAGRKIGKKAWDAYVVESADPMVLDRIAWGFNDKVNGRRNSYEDCLAHAISYCRKHGVPAEAAAQEFGVPKWAVHREVRVAELREVLEKHRLKPAAALPADTLHKMGALATLGEDLFVEAAVAVAASGATGDDVVGLMRDVKAARTHAAKLGCIKKFAASEQTAQRRAETKGGTVKIRVPLPREKLARALKEVNRVLEGYPDRRALVPPGKAQLKELRQLATDVVRALINTYGLGTALQLPREEAV